MAHKDNVAVMIDVGAKFFDSVYFRGWLASAETPLHSLTLSSQGRVLAEGRVQVGGEGVPPGAEFRGWQVQALIGAADKIAPHEMTVDFVLEDGKSISFATADLLAEKHAANPVTALVSRFFQTIGGDEFVKVLDLGGRDRSEMGLWPYEPRHKVTVLDIIAAPGVDVVGDAHEASTYFPAGHFDAVFCNAVMEHILMPWRVATEVAKVLRVGGVGLFHTHQTIGMHDRPWDFWRYSDTSWDAIFNAHTGFEIVDRQLGGEMFIIPFAWRPGIEFEKAAGYESSCVMVRKIAEPRANWQVTTSDIVKTMYPKS